MRHYFVDEAGDANLFDAQGRVIVGRDGCSHHFILGMVDIENPDALGSELESLRSQLLADPYFAKVPSMRSESKKTALVFHAKDDLPEIRREVFSLLRRHKIRFLAVVRTKQSLVEYVRQRNALDNAYRYHPNELYDHLVQRLFKNMLHKDDGYQIHFARRGK